MIFTKLRLRSSWQRGMYRITFDTGGYDPNGFFPRVVIEFRITDAKHYHVPLLLSAFGYSTYRGS